MRPLADFLVQPGLAVAAVLRRLPSTSFPKRLKWDAVDYPQYAYGTYQAALQARALGLEAITAIELGVAGGNGLIALENICERVATDVGLSVSVFGFDGGEAGMPEPVDYRDLPYLWQPGFFKMDVAALRNRLRRADLILGDVAMTVPRFIEEAAFPPIGFVAFDLDYYSSTVAALQLLEADTSLRLPRIFCYFDDVIGDDWELHSPYTGELLAIREFNRRHEKLKLSRINGLAHKRRIRAAWNDVVFVCHDFCHPLYNEHIHPSHWDFSLRESQK